MGEFGYVGDSRLSEAVTAREGEWKFWEACLWVIHCSMSTQKGNGARNDGLESIRHMTNSNDLAWITMGYGNGY